MSDSWKEWEGQTIDGKFPLIRYLGETEHSVVFQTEWTRGAQRITAAIKMVPAGPDHGERQLARWKEAAGISHPHLLAIYDTGRCEIAGISAVYALIEYAPENLAQIVPSRALAQDEARAMLGATLSALSYLHSRGLVHARIKPSNIMASGDEVKLSSDGITRAGEALDTSRNPSAYDAPEYSPGVVPVASTAWASGDVWSLGMTLVESLTGSLPAARTEGQNDPLVPGTLPQPFLDLAAHCLRRHPQARWTVAQLTARLEGRPETAAPVQTMPSVPAVRPVSVATRPVPERPSGPATRIRAPRAAQRIWVFGAALGVALVLAAIGVATIVRHHNTEPAATSAVTNIPTAAPAPARADSARQSRKQQQDAPAASLAQDEQEPQSPASVPALAHPETAPAETSNAVANLPGGLAARGAVLHQELPEVLASARNSIRGTVRVQVRVDVNRNGDVRDAKLEARGPSRYFARVAVESARDWKFRPPAVGGQGVESTWRLEFEFTRQGTKVTPVQEMR